MGFHKITAILICLLVSSTLSQGKFPTFAQYVEQFSKKYDTTEQYAKREKLYQETVAKLQTITEYTPAVNHMSDWTAEEIQNWKNLNVTDINQRLGRPLTQSRVGAPTSLDWRTAGVVTSIKSQGNCGGCWTFAAAAHAESKLIIEKRFTNTNIDLSEQYLLSCTRGSSCDGGYLETVMKTALKLPSQAQYPYTPFSSQPAGICSAAGVSVGQKNYDYYNLSDNEIITLLQVGPLAISINADDWQFYGSGVFSCVVGAQVNHAVLLVGYTPDYWIVKNQWSIRFGIAGYIHVTRTRSRNCAIGYSVHVIKGAGDSTNDPYFVTTYNGTLPDSVNNTSNNTQSGLFEYYFMGLWALLALLAFVY